MVAQVSVATDTAVVPLAETPAAPPAWWEYDAVLNGPAEGMRGRCSRAVAFARLDAVIARQIWAEAHGVRWHPTTALDSRRASSPGAIENSTNSPHWRCSDVLAPRWLASEDSRTIDVHPHTTEAAPATNEDGPKALQEEL